MEGVLPSSDAGPQKAARRIKVVKTEVSSVLKKEHLNVTKAGEIIRRVSDVLY